MATKDRMAEVMGALGDDLRLRVAFTAYTAARPITITEIRDALDLPKDIMHNNRLHYALRALVNKGVLVKRAPGPGFANEYEINPDVSTEVLAFLVNVLT